MIYDNVFIVNKCPVCQSVSLFAISNYDLNTWEIYISTVIQRDREREREKGRGKNHTKTLKFQKCAEMWKCATTIVIIVINI